MNDNIKSAILKSFELRISAGIIQIEKGISDTGARSEVTSGKHLLPLTDAIISDIMCEGLVRDEIFSDSGDTDIPGWFRASKKWDVLVTNEGRLIAAIELKSICGSYGNNINNRVEEAIGQSVDAQYMINNGLLNCTIPPLLGYVILVKEEQKSTTPTRVTETHFPVDPIFKNASYVDRFKIMCQRLRKEGLFSAVWFVVANPETGNVYEPDPDLSYDKFIAELRGKIQVFLS